MSNLFNNKTTFNDDIRSWRVSSAVTLTGMFTNATAFNSNSEWNSGAGYSSTTPSYEFFNALIPITDSTIQTAVDLWVSDQAAAEATYGHINGWDTSSVTDMSTLFFYKNLLPSIGFRSYY